MDTSNSFYNLFFEMVSENVFQENLLVGSLILAYYFVNSTKPPIF